MYLVKEKILEKLNITEQEFDIFNHFNMLHYSVKTDKYNIDNILQKRTLTLGIENLLSPKQKSLLLKKMEEFSSFKNKLTKESKNGTKFTNSGTNRLHRQIGKSYNLTSLEADSGLKLVEGIVTSTNTWYDKTIKNLENKILKIEEQLEEDLLKNKESKEDNKKVDFHRNYFKGKKKKLEYLKNKLAKLQSDNQLSIHFGKNIYNKIQNQRNELFHENNLKNRNKIKSQINRLKEEYKQKRLEYFIEGSVGVGNKKINLEYSTKSKFGYQLRFKFSNKKSEHIVLQIDKFPSSHVNTFSLENYNKQSNRIGFNSKGKLILNCTYSYIKPIEIKNQDINKGTIGIDISPNEVTCVFVKNDGNPYKKISYNISHLHDKKNKDTIRNISEILEEILEEGIYHKFYSITIENLKFDNHKYKYRTKTLNRLLSKFPFESFNSLMESKTTRKGIKLIKVNPAYTSYIGLKKYSYRDDITDTHTKNSKDYSAALVIGRRGLGFKERSVICIRLFCENQNNKIESFNVNALLNESEKDFSTTNHCSKSNWSTWINLKKIDDNIPILIKSLTVKNMLSKIYKFYQKPLQASVCNCVSILNYPTQSHNPLRIPTLSRFG